MEAPTALPPKRASVDGWGAHDALSAVWSNAPPGEGPLPVARWPRPAPIQGADAVTWTLEILLPETLRKPDSATCIAVVDETNAWSINDLNDERTVPLLELFAGLASDGVADTTVDRGYRPDPRPGAIHAAAVVDALRGSRIIGASDP